MSAPMKRHVAGEENNTSKYSSHDSSDKLLKEFIGWANGNDFNLSKKVKVGRDGSCAQYGMVAIDDISAGEELFQIPRRMLLSPETSAISDLIKGDETVHKGTSGWVPLLLSLMFEYNNPSSPWRPYLDLVPDFKELDLPMFWPSDERTSLLQGTGVSEAVDKDLTSIAKEFTDIMLPFVQKHRDKFSPVCEELEFCKKMVAFVMAYSFTEPVGGDEDESDDDDDDRDGTATGSPPMMVPMADILNHIAKNNAHLQFEEDCLKMVATKSISKGEEVFNTYGQTANWQLLHMYGFAEAYPENLYDTVDVPGSCLKEAGRALPVNTDQLLQTKADLLRDLGLPLEDTVFILGVDGVLTEEEMLQTLKVLGMGEEELTQYREDEGWEEAEEEGEEESLLFDNMKKLKKEWQEILLRCGNSCLQRYGTTLDEDQKLLKSTTLTNRQRTSVFVSYGQKKLLHCLIESCSSR